MLARHLEGDTGIPSSLVGYLDHLADLERFVFHGSNRRDITELGIERRSTDSRAFGRQQAVFATSDPHWAAYFALVDRSNVDRLRNGSISFSGRARTRWYQRDVVVLDPNGPLLTEGRIYVLPRDTFHPEPKILGIVDTAQWVSPMPVKPLFSLRITAERYPLARHIRVVGSR
ncbi:MAG TPA: hypothetical protein VF246_00330 [Acidimicrobiia bacterium]